MYVYDAYLLYDACIQKCNWEKSCLLWNKKQPYAGSTPWPQHEGLNNYVQKTVSTYMEHTF